MKLFALVLFFTFGVTLAAHASIDFDNESSFFPVQIETSVPMTSETRDSEFATESTSRYCCIRRGGTYCDMGYYDRFGQPCKCTLGNNVYPGHVCR
ncbi:hypothetical protein QJS83_12920 [Bdellovibrio sp. 22V]|uniref:hypothetical protein n=1 Tax=Bdellovibrio TaxID=958 RepID=UPI0025429738|nr:hypothetical protein [Bdellovibrio sp. 22V]WII71365.1 hypothetical protein QJS83_12920 [Bdellovibrio sp. 22V]